MPPVILSIAGFDPSSGAGVTADIKTAAAHGCFGVACITGLTVQSTQGVWQVEPVSGRLVADTLNRLTEDMEIAAVRIGMLASAEVARAVAGFLESRKPIVVLDPVLQSSSGKALLDSEGFQVVMNRLLPLAQVVTPNSVEAAAMAGFPVEDWSSMLLAAQAIQSKGANAVLVTGGHLDSNTDLLLENGEASPIEGQKVASNATHGTGCAMACAIACNLAKGSSLKDATMAAKRYVREAIEAAYPIGKGRGPMNHLNRMKD